MNLDWKQPEPDGDCAAAIDEAGNLYTTPANGEIVSVRLIDGREGCGWTPDEAWHIASERPIKCCDAPDLEKVEDRPDGWTKTHCKHCGATRIIKLDYAEWIELLMGKEWCDQADAEMQDAIAQGEAMQDEAATADALAQRDLYNRLCKLIDDSAEISILESRLLAAKVSRKIFVNTLFVDLYHHTDMGEDMIVRHNGDTYLIQFDVECGTLLGVCKKRVLC